jgi:hypothetical protein
MNNNTPGFSKLADAVNALNDGVDCLGKRMDAMGSYHEGPSKTAAERNKENDDRKAKSGSYGAMSKAERKKYHEKNFGSKREDKKDEWSDEARKKASETRGGDKSFGKSREENSRRASEENSKKQPQDPGNKGMAAFLAKKAKADASREVHEFYATHAKKTAQKAIDGGDPKMAAKWVDYGTSHAKQAEDKAAKEDKLEAPPEDKKKDSAEDRKQAEERKQAANGYDKKTLEKERLRSAELANKAKANQATSGWHFTGTKPKDK